MNDGVVDASVALKWLVEERHSDQARALLETSLKEQASLLGPPHLKGEVLNALYRRTHRSSNEPLSAQEAINAADRFFPVPLKILSPDDLYARSFALALRLQLGSIYDAIYVTLAEIEGVELWTADERLLTSLRGRAPWVRWIGDYSAGDAG